MKFTSKFLTLVVLSIMLTSGFLSAQKSVEVNAGGDVVSRYIWRGLDFGKSPAIQPSLSFGYAGLELGFWGNYTLNETASGSDEIDMWVGYTFGGKDISLTAMVTDYYFPNAGLKFGNYNNYDDPDGAGAHTLEAGMVLSSEKFPLVISAFYNFYNDAGNNTYFQIDYPFAVKDYDMTLFCGASAGSEDNPNYYGTDKFNVINIGVKAGKNVKITDNFSLPVFVSYIINPRVEISHLVFGISF